MGKKKTHISTLLCSIMCLSIFGQNYSEIFGNVQKVNDKEVTISYTGDLIPNVGDSVFIGIDIDGEFVPYEDAWIVMEIGSGYVNAINVTTNMIPMEGYKAKISSLNPGRPTYHDYFKPDWNVNIAMYVSPLDLHVGSLRLFESDQGFPPLDQRVYQKYFPASETNFINWELALRYPHPKGRVNFKIVEKYMYYTGEEIADSDLETFTEWENSSHWDGWGSEDFNTWKIGKYYLQLYIRNQLVAQEAFFIY